MTISKYVSEVSLRELYPAHLQTIKSRHERALERAGAGHAIIFSGAEADTFAREELARMVRDLAWAAGTSSRVVELKTEDQIPNTADGKQIFMGRIIHAKLTGQPDIVAADNHYRLAAVAN